LFVFYHQMQLLTQIRLAMSFSSYEQRLQCVQARLQAISTLGINLFSASKYAPYIDYVHVCLY